MLQRAPHNSTKEEREEAIRDQSLVPSPPSPSPIKTFYARKKRSKGRGRTLISMEIAPLALFCASLFGLSLLLWVGYCCSVAEKEQFINWPPL